MKGIVYRFMHICSASPTSYYAYEFSVKVDAVAAEDAGITVPTHAISHASCPFKRSQLS